MSRADFGTMPVPKPHLTSWLGLAPLWRKGYSQKMFSREALENSSHKQCFVGPTGQGVAQNQREERSPHVSCGISLDRGGPGSLGAHVPGPGLGLLLMGAMGSLPQVKLSIGRPYQGGTCCEHLEWVGDTF